MNTTSERTGAVSVMMPLSNSKSGSYIMEIFKDVKGYEGSYQVSNLGNIRSLKCNKIRILKPILRKSGYYYVTLYQNKHERKAIIHRLIGAAFLPNPQNKPEINHKNGIKADNRLENLEWVTQSENMIHSYKNGLQKPLKGSLNGNAKLNEAQIKEIRQLYATGNYLQREIASKYNLSLANINRIVNYKRWKHVIPLNPKKQNLY